MGPSNEVASGGRPILFDKVSGNRNQSAMLATTKLAGISKEFLTYCTGCTESRVDDSNTGASIVPTKSALRFFFHSCLNQVHNQS